MGQRRLCFKPVSALSPCQANATPEPGSLSAQKDTDEVNIPVHQTDTENKPPTATARSDALSAGVLKHNERPLPEVARSALADASNLAAQPTGLSEYEKQRLARMEANFKKLQSLGLHNGINAAMGVKPAAPKCATKRKSAPAAVAPTRRSARRKSESLGGTVDDNIYVTAPNPSRRERTPEPEETLTPAPWAGPGVALQLQACTAGHRGEPWAMQLPADEEIEGLHALHCKMSSRDLKGVYTMSWYGGLLAAAGKGGFCSLYSIPQAAQEEELHALATCKLHSSWISDAQLFQPLSSQSVEQCTETATHLASTSSLPWLLTACNDGSLSLWNPANVNFSGRFSLVCSETVHSRGVYSMHMRPRAVGGISSGPQAADREDVQVLTCSKDAGIALVSVCDCGMEVVRRWDDVHANIAKAVRWRDQHIAASAGNERAVCILDTRCDSASSRIEDAHDSAINCLCWATSSPGFGVSSCGAPSGADNLLLSVSFDPQIRVHDMRRTDTPLAILCGHTQKPKCKGIQQAAFTWGARGVVTGGEGTEMLHLYDIRGAQSVRSAQRLSCSEGVRMVSQTDIGVQVAGVSCSGNLVAASGAGGAITVTRAVPTSI